jgi:hypothetical protein
LSALNEATGRLDARTIAAVMISLRFIVRTLLFWIE